MTTFGVGVVATSMVSMNYRPILKTTGQTNAHGSTGALKKLYGEI